VVQAAAKEDELRRRRHRCGNRCDITRNEHAIDQGWLDAVAGAAAADAVLHAVGEALAMFVDGYQDQRGSDADGDDGQLERALAPFPVDRFDVAR
jgi:hypothetical protein